MLLACISKTCGGAPPEPPALSPPVQRIFPPQRTLPKQVVILHSQRTLSTLNADWNRGILQALEELYQEPLEIEVEYLDLVRDYYVERYSTRWTELLREKYGPQQVKLVIPVSDPALEFVLKNREQIFPSAAIVFCSATEELARKAVQQPAVTGVAFQPDSAKTVALIRQLLPETRHLVLLGGASKSDRAIVSAALKAMPKTNDDFDIKHWDGFGLDILQTVLPKQDPKTVLLVMSCDRDVPGFRFSTVDYTRRICQLTQLPVFSLFDSTLGTGVVGGRMISPQGQGKLAGQIAARVLSGMRPEEISIAGLDANYVALDARQLERLQIPQDRVPRDAQIRFGKTLDWAVITRYLLIGGAALLLQSVLIGVLLVNRSRRLRAEREARALAGMILTAQEDERSRVARELHDDLSQRLAAASLDVAILERNLTSKTSVVDVLSRLKQGLMTICRDVHQLSHRMHSSVLEDLGLEAALRSECASASERHDLNVDFSCQGVPPQVPQDVSLCLYRIVQEALRNAVKHSQATGVQVALKHDGQQLQLEIRDDGVGFDATKAGRTTGVPESAGDTTGLGIASLKERVRLVGGTLRIESAPNEGVTIDVQVPCHTASA